MAAQLPLKTQDTLLDKIFDKIIVLETPYGAMEFRINSIKFHPIQVSQRVLLGKEPFRAFPILEQIKATLEIYSQGIPIEE